jgi:hypothetical protein
MTPSVLAGICAALHVKLNRAPTLGTPVGVSTITLKSDGRAPPRGKPAAANSEMLKAILLNPFFYLAVKIAQLLH